MPTVARLKQEFDLLEAEIAEVKERLDVIEDKVDIVWDRSISQDLRISDLEEWQEQVDDKLENE